MSIDRRLFLGGAAATVVVLPVATSTEAAVLKDKVADDGWTILEARPGSLRLASDPAGETAIWGYGGRVPGPLLRIKKGDELKVRLINKLTQPTSVCWHGVRVPNAMDGVAGLTQKPVLPGESFDYRFTPPDAGLFWYHPHVWPQSAEQTDRGLYGVLIVDEAEPPAADQELLLVLDDWSLDDKGQIKDVFDVEAARHLGRIGPLVTVNSKPAPSTTVLKPGSRVRLRLLSAMSARIMIVGFEGAHPMVQAIDGQPCELFEPVRQTIPVGPGARFDIMIDLPTEAGKEARLILRGEGGADRPLLLFKTEGEARKPWPAVTALPQNGALPTQIPLERALKMDLVIDGGAKPPVPPAAEPPRKGVKNAAASKTAPPKTIPPSDNAHLWTINGIASDGVSGKPLFTVKRGSAVSLALVNRSAFAQQIHVHGHVMRLLHDLDDGWEPYWRNAVLVADGHTKHVAFVADNPGKWALESLVLDRQVSGLAAWFEVT
ncbi:multicopper oxidase family protein [Beijerinckia sp. L45]|uniref:multicopper oxidase family protein n=1 Tax=Beijerinckia sp. L45 TaxID=1641855 RepID=UPI00131AE7AF|nr:multicopper oxidase family protein [Beijerinckia sp. L45]